MSHTQEVHGIGLVCISAPVYAKVAFVIIVLVIVLILIMIIILIIIIINTVFFRQTPEGPV